VNSRVLQFHRRDGVSVTCAIQAHATQDSIRRVSPANDRPLTDAARHCAALHCSRTQTNEERGSANAHGAHTRNGHHASFNTVWLIFHSTINGASNCAVICSGASLQVLLLLNRHPNFAMNCYCIFVRVLLPSTAYLFWSCFNMVRSCSRLVGLLSSESLSHFNGRLHSFARHRSTRSLCE
jgi:hypothetical protein